MRPLLILLLLATTTFAREPVESPAAKLVPWLFEQGDSLTQMPFRDVIRYATGKEVRPIDAGDPADQRVVKQISTALDEVLRRMNEEDSPVQEIGRINEVSGPFEEMLRQVLNRADGFSCGFATIEGGKVQRSGYPDLRLVDEQTQRVYYLDPKLYAQKSRNSSFRSFYYEPKTSTNKVRDDAAHLILAIQHQGRKGGHWRFSGWDIVDLHDFKVRLKAEFQGSNRDMYRKDAIVASGTADAAALEE
jgi:hypothetical protein